jgi:hypothetical protein
MSIKRLQREIMLSSVYQLSTEDDKEASAKDSGDRLYWRATRKRLDAEEVRDAVLDVSGDLDDSLGGPSKDLTPDYHRRTIYGKVSRYKLDSYLQLFDFPPPNISAEKRFTTTVPLQRLFLMNSDFMQIEAEDLYKRVAAEPDNRARIRKMYELVYGREPKESEIQLGLDFLKTEPLKEYEEEKAKAKEDEAKKAEEAKKGRGRGKPGAAASGDAKGDAKAGDSKPEMAKAETAENPEKAVEKAPEKNADAESESPAPAPEEAAAMPDDPNAGMGMGMMGGMGNGRRGGAPKPVEVKYEPTVWGRYAKLLLSSTEFIFVN